MRPPLRLLALLALLAAAPVQAGTLIVGAHRGLVPRVAENTLAAARAAIAAGASVIEIDLRTTADGHIVIMHDPTVDRTTSGHGAIARMTLAQVRMLDAGGAEKVPSLAEMLDLVHGTAARLLLDVKRADLAAILAEVREHDAVGQVIFGLRSADEVRRLRALDPAMLTLAFMDRQSDLSAYLAAGVGIVRLWSDWVIASSGPDMIARVHAAGRPVWALVGSRLPRDEAGWRALHTVLTAAGVDAIITNRSDLLAEQRAIAKQSH